MTEQFKEQITAVSTDETFLLLLDITHPDPTYGFTFHIVNDIIGHDVGGTIYEPYAFSFVAPKTTATGATASLVLDDVDRRFAVALSRVPSPQPTCTITLVKASDMTVAELDPWVFNLGKMNVSSATVTMDLLKETVLNNALSGFNIDATNFPGFFS
jgi:hypothetical protein